MQIIEKFPPNFQAINNRFHPGNRVVFTYGDVIYNPYRGNVTPDIMVHEETHFKQQMATPGNVPAWWKLYIEDTEFRLKQEVEAYQNQYEWAKSHLNRHDRRALLKRIAVDLSGPMYDNMVSLEEATNLITKTNDSSIQN